MAFFLISILSSNTQVVRLPFWPFVITMVLVSAILYTRAMNSNNWSLVLRSVFSPRAVQQLIREENTLDNSYSGLLVLTFFFSLALFLYYINDYFNLSVVAYPLLTYFTILTVLFLVYLIRVVSLYLLQWVFEVNAAFEEYLVGLLNINIVLGACLIPINLLLAYYVSFPSFILIYLGLILLIFSFAIRYLRIFEMGRRNGLKVYNIILYLCTLEIIPIVILIKLLENSGIQLNML